MANKSRFIVAESSIKSFFHKGPKKVFSREELRGIFEERRGIWNLPLYSYADKFIDQLVRREILKAQEITFEGYMVKKERFAAPDASIFQIATSLINKSYLSHYSAVFLHNLTTQVPKNVYITFEQSAKSNVNRTLEQKAIDAAFAKPHKMATTKAVYGDYTFIIHNGMHTNRTGVYSLNDISITNIERTLVDVTVRPNYAGGVYEVLNTYKKAVPQISINKLIATLETMNFIYPYYQVIGFYLERAGYEGKKLEVLQKKKMEFDFYLAHEMQDKEYSKEWKLYYPRGM